MTGLKGSVPGQDQYIDIESPSPRPEVPPPPATTPLAEFGPVPPVEPDQPQMREPYNIYTLRRINRATRGAARII